MSKASAMVGNSSAGLMEAPSFGLPVVNIGTRQEGRLRARNVIDVGYSADEILDGINQACDPLFRESIRDVENPYGDGHAAERIVKVLMETPLDIIVKRFNVNHS
jgi:UDP-N-acetylglucosamine 2-epimerase